MLRHGGQIRSRCRSAAAYAGALLAGLLAVPGAPAAAAPPSTSMLLQYYAGTGTAGAAVPGPYASSPLNTPMGTAFDSRGNTYLATYGSNACQVLKINTSGTLSVFAGTGVCANATAGPALASGLNKPTNMAFDSNDNLYVTEDVGNRVVKITPGGTLSIFAGTGASGVIVEGPATSSPMRVSGLVIDGSDNVYLGDWVRGQILKVTPGGTLSIIAGNGTTTVTPGPARQSGMRGPYGLDLDSAGNLYATDYYLHYVYKITPGGILSIFAGTGGTTAPVAGPATSSPLFRPWDVDVDASDNVFVSVAGTPSIVGITPGGTLSVVAGTGVSGTTVPGPATATPLRSITYMAFDGPTLYYSDLSGHRVNRLVTGVVPGAPGNLQATPGAPGSLDLSFDPASGNGSAVTSYQVSTDDGATWGPLTTSGSGPITGTVSGLVAGRSYTVRVRAVNAIGTGPAGASATAVAPAGPPGAPTALQADARHLAAELTFTVPADDGGEPITSYQVSTDDGTTWSALTVTGTGATRTGTVTGLTDGQLYTVRVRARNSVGPGTASASTTVTPAPSAPGAPGDVTAERGDASVTVSFDPPADDGGSAVTSYDVSTDDGATWTSLTTTGTSRRTGTVSPLTNGQEYEVRVRARNAAGPGTASAARTVTPATTPGAPGDPQAERRDRGAALSFDPPSVTGGAPVTSYEVSSDNGTTWQALATSGSSPVTGTVSSLVNGQEYELRVRARNAVGAGPASAPVTVTPATVPDAPSGLAAVRGDRSATVTFGVPATGGSAITAYEVSTDDGGTWQALTVTGSGSTRTGTVSSLTNGQEYPLRVRARNAAGAGAASPAVTVTPATVPGAPSGLAAVRGDRSATLTFTVPADGGSAITSYQVSADDGGTWQALAVTGSGPTRTGTVSSLTNGQEYSVRVRARNTAGAGAASTAATVTPATVPAAPAGLTAVRGDASATVTFSVPADGGSAITSYQVSADDGGTWQALAVTGSGSTRTGTVSSLVNGQEYSLRVRARNAVGAGDAGTAATVTPATVPDAPDGLDVTGGNERLSIEFTEAAANGTPVLRYEVSVDDGSAWTTLDVEPAGGARLTGTVTGLVNGTGYPVRVRAVNDAGHGPAGPAVTGVPVPGVPDAPDALQATPGNGFAALTFTVPAGNGSPVLGFQVTIDDGVTWRPLAAQAGGSNVTATLSGLVNGTGYTVRVRAFNLTGPGPASAAAGVTPRPDPAGPPTGLTLSSRDRALIVRFQPPAGTGGSAIERYEASAGAGWSTLDTSPAGGGALTASVGGLTNGVTYPVRIRAVTAAGPGAAGDPVNGVPGVPGAPRAVTPVAGVSSITVTWEPPAGTDVVVTGYLVVAEPGPATCRPEAGRFSCVLGAVAGRPYRVRVVAEAAAGQRTSSEPSEAVTPAAPPVTAEPPSTDLSLTTDRGDIDSVEPGEEITLLGEGFAAHSTVTVTLYSEPQVLATVTTDAEGSFRYTVRVPAGLAPGAHTLVASGVDPDGEPYSRVLDVTVAADGGDGLPVTGPDLGRAILVWLLLGLTLVGVGAGMTLVGRPRPARLAGSDQRG